MGFGFTTARAAVPDAHRLTQALAEAFDELRAKTGQPSGQAARRRDQGAAPPSRRPR
jgi:hypothetical protein